MTRYAVDPALFEEQPGENPDGPVIPMVVSLHFPGMDAHSCHLQREFTRIAFAAVRQAGGRPRLVDSAAEVLIPAAELWREAAGIVFLGGGDVDRSCYADTGPPPANEYGVDKRADEYCLNLIREAVARDMPVLAICRGSQLLNVAFGGTLIPDIAQWQMHRGGAGEPLFLDEEVLLAADSEIARIMARTRVTVRNGHHQAVREVAPALRATAWAHDGIVEGAQHREASWVLGIQWHPEEPQADIEDRVRVFDALLARARGYRVGG